MITERAGRLRDHLHLHRDRMFRLLERLVAAESPSENPETQEAVFSMLASELAAIDYVVTRIPGRTSGGQLLARPAERPRGRPYQVMVGHCDTVWPLGTVETMPIEVRDGRIYGPGTYDMKGGLAQMVFALKALRELGLDSEVTPVVLINSDEETGSQDSTATVARLARRADRVMVLEPALPGGEVKTARKGVGRFTIRVTGRAAHAGLEPDRGVSAIVELASVIRRLTELNAPKEGVTVNVGTIDGGMRANVVAPAARAEVDVRIAERGQAVHIESAIRSLRPETAGAEIEVEGGINSWPLERTPRNMRFWEVARGCGRELGLELVDASVGGGSDGNTASLYTATLDGLGPIGDGAHAVHEHVVLESMVERGALLALLLLAPPMNGAEAGVLEVGIEDLVREPAPAI